jgi:hypothetical protein
MTPIGLNRQFGQVNAARLLSVNNGGDASRPLIGARPFEDFAAVIDDERERIGARRAL